MRALRRTLWRGVYLFKDTTLNCIYEDFSPNLTIKEGYVSQKADTLRVLRDNTCTAIVILSDPIVLAKAEEEEPWGYFQFPRIYRTDDNILLVSYSMKEDSHMAYGDNSYGLLISKDEGNTW